MIDKEKLQNLGKDVDARIATLTIALGCKLEAHLVESLISLFNSGVLEHRVTSPRLKFNHENTHMTVEQSSSVYFAGKEKIIEQERQIKRQKEIIDKYDEFLNHYCSFAKNSYDLYKEVEDLKHSIKNASGELP